jgi:hemerythrin superfamily protein
MDMADDFDEKKDIIQELRQEIEAHTYVEENLFYPLFKDREEFMELIQDSYEDHQEMRNLVADLQNSESTEEIDDRFEDLLECVEDHVDEEENDLFPKIETLMNEDELNQLGDRMEATKREFLQSEQAA